MAQPELGFGRGEGVDAAARDDAESGVNRRTQARPVVFSRHIGEPAVNEVLRTGTRRLHSLPNDGRNPRHFVPDETGETFDAWARNDNGQAGVPDSRTGYYPGYHYLVSAVDRENLRQPAEEDDEPSMQHPRM